MGVKEQTQTIQIQGTEEIAAEVKPFPPSYLLKLNENFTFPGYTAYSILGALFLWPKGKASENGLWDNFWKYKKTQGLTPPLPYICPWSWELFLLFGSSADNQYFCEAEAVKHAVKCVKNTEE